MLRTICVLSVERGYQFCEYMRLFSPIGIIQSLPVGRMGNDRSTRPICLTCALLLLSSLISANDNQAVGTEVVTETITDSSFPSESVDGLLQTLQTSTEETILPTTVTILDDTYTPNNEFEGTEKMPDAKGLSVSDINDTIFENIKEKDAGEAIKLPKRHAKRCSADKMPTTRFPHLEHPQNHSCNEEALKFDHAYPTGVIIHEMFCEGSKLRDYLVVAGKNLKSEFLPLLPLPFNIVTDEMENVSSLRSILVSDNLFEMMEQSVGSLQVFLEDSQKLVVLFDTLKNCIPLSSIRETISRLRIVIQQFFYHIRGFAIDLGPLYDIYTSVYRNILGELSEIFVVAEEALMNLFFENLPNSLEVLLNPFYLLSAIDSVVEFLYQNFSPFINSDTFHRFAVNLKTIADSVRGFYCGLYASGIRFVPTFIENFISNTCKASTVENGGGPSTLFPDIPRDSWRWYRTNEKCPICPDLPPPDISSGNAGMQSSTPQSVIVKLEASAEHQYQRLSDSLTSSVRNGIINTFPFQPKWSANTAEPSSLDSSLTNNPTYNEPSSPSLQQAVTSPLPILIDMPPFNREPPPSDLSRPTALPPHKNSAADKYDQLLPDALTTETYDDSTECAYSSTSKAIENSQGEGNSDANIPVFPPLPLFSGGSSCENDSSIESIDTPQSGSSDTNPIDQLKAHQPILQSLFSVPKAAKFQKDFLSFKPTV